MIYGDDVSVYVYPTELWTYIRNNPELIRENKVVIAENPADGVEIQVGFDADIPYILVFQDEALVRKEPLVSLEDSIITLRVIYSTYLIPPSPQQEDPEEDEETAEIDDEQLCMLRRIELEDAICSFMETVLCEDYNLVSDEEIDAILEETLSVIASYGLPVYAPTIIDDELVEYPYDQVVESN